MRRLALVAVLTLAGCGVTHKSLPKLAPAVCTSVGPPCSAIVPEGARGADRTHFLNRPVPPTLTGSNIRIDTAGVSFIAQFENVYQAVYCPYWDPWGRVWSRAYGETDWSDTFGHVCISHAQALYNVKALMERQYQYAIRGLGVDLNAHQIAALDSFVWNLGPGSMGWQPLRSQLQHHNPYGLLAYDRAGGVVLAALVRRRREEVAKFLQAEPHPKPPPKPIPTRQLLARRAVLRRVLLNHGCIRRRDHHKRLGPTCRRWFREGAQINRELHKRHVR